MIDITNKRYGRFIVIQLTGKNKMGKLLWKCKCDCGNDFIAIGENIKSGNTKSCGCLFKEEIIKRNTIHGLRYHLLYKTWKHIKERCTNVKSKDYKYYGGRGIKICDEWKDDVKTFYDWCMSNGWKKGLEIDREDNNGNYEPGNCRFVTHKTNGRNTRKSLIWIIDGKEFSSANAAAKELNKSEYIIRKMCNRVKNKKGQENNFAYSKY